MPKGNNFPTLPTEAQLLAVQQALAALETALAAVPDVSPDLRSNASLSPERLPLADKALEVALAAPIVMRRTFDPARLAAKLAAYRQLAGLGTGLAKADRKLANALNVLGADMLFDVNNIHEDVEKDQGETVDLGSLRTELNDYYAHRAARGKDKAAAKNASQGAA